MTEQDILDLIQRDKWMMDVLKIAQSFNLKDWIIGAGFVRNKVWNHLSGKGDVQHSTDIDLVYFDQTDVDESTEKDLEQSLRQKLEIDWSVKNQARMHLVNGDEPYLSTEDAISQWPETATAVGVTLNVNGELKLIAPYGINDLVNFIVRPSPKFTHGIEVVKQRVSQKNWLEKWPQVKIIEI